VKEKTHSCIYMVPVLAICIPVAVEGSESCVLRVMLAAPDSLSRLVSVRHACAVCPSATMGGWRESEALGPTQVGE